MTTAPPSIFARDDTMFGVCEALAEDLGFRSNLLRLGFALALFWNPVAAAACYAALGLLVAVTRWLVPEPPATAVEQGGAAPAGDAAWEDFAEAA